MNVRELIFEEINLLGEDQLAELYSVIRNFVQSEKSKKQSFMSKLRQIRIEGPEDFSANLDSYIMGRKQNAEKNIC